MIVPSDRRINKYDIKLNPDTIKAHFQNQKPVMKNYFSDYARYFSDIEERTKAILDSNAVKMSVYPMYYSFARQVGKKVRNVGLGGDVLFSEIDIIKSIWTHRGLNETILEQILRDVFGIAIPITQP